MNVPGIAKRMARLSAWRQTSRPSAELTADEKPLRSELYSVDQLERHARHLAESHELATGPAAEKLIPRLQENEQVLVQTYDLVTAAVTANRRISPAAEWLLDNFYLIEEQIHTARRHLPRSYGRELPRLAEGTHTNQPRVYAIALELISHVDGRLDAVSLDAFITAYAIVQPLKLGELWAVPIVLRLALIENLRRVAVRVAATRIDRDLATVWADRMVSVVEQAPTDLILVLADMARADPPLSGAFLGELTRHLQGQSPYFSFATSWIEQRLSEHGLTIEQLVRADGHAQAADQVSIGNSITSLRFLSSTDWRDFVEHHSLVEKILRDDPAGAYTGMDFATRDRYRHGVEDIARRSGLAEHDIARMSIELARKPASADPAGRTSHVGYYLIDRGRPALESLAKTRRSVRHTLAGIGRYSPLLTYLLAILLAAAGVMVEFIGYAHWHGHGAAMFWLFIPAGMCALQIGVAVVNWLATALVKARPLPRMDFRKGISDPHRTMVVVPTMLSNAAGIVDLLEGLEVRYLANRDNNLHFALLTDFEDAAAQALPGDEDLVQLAATGIEELNKKYVVASAASHPTIFFLFHRPRRWNEQEGVWMGHERKRGKLADFNALLRGRAIHNDPGSGKQNGPSDDRFSRVVGDTALLAAVRYVITLDTDTQLPRDSAREMAGAMAHPLNRPVFDAKRNRVVDGYAILQPRVGVSLPSAGRSWFVKLFAGDVGVDPYTRVVSDVYQDLFGEGSFVGKGIYDVDAFEQTCANFPENTILSHDLLESAYARSGLISDVELYEEYPSRYPADVSRRHRWIRGDWQIAAWLLPRVPSNGPSSVRNPVSALSWWKIFDNLRRSLVPIAMLMLLLVAWLLLPEMATAATVLVLFTIAAGSIVSLLASLASKPSDVALLAHFRMVGASLGRHLAQFLFTLVFLPYDAYVSLDAIARTAFRVLWSRRRLLEWKTSSDAHRGSQTDVSKFFRSMWFAPITSFATVVLLLLFHRQAPVAVWPLLYLWVVSPFVGWWLSRRLKPESVRLSERQRLFLEKSARRTWRYFETFVTEEDNWLPPDNFQEHPTPTIAHRTSPTNIGMGLLADLAACDFGYCSVARLVDRVRKTLQTLEKMEKYRGHFYNWYDTRSIKPLLPTYVSMVDSGNLAGHLLVFRQGLLEFVQATVLPPRLFGGLRDTVSVLLDAARGLHQAGEGAGELVVAADILRKIEQISSDLEHPPTKLRASVQMLSGLKAAAAEIVANAGTDEDVRWWAVAFQRACFDHHDDLLQSAGWLTLQPMPAMRSGAELAMAPQHVGRALPANAMVGGQSPSWERIIDLLAKLDNAPSLADIAALQGNAVPEVDVAIVAGADDPISTGWLKQLRQTLIDSSHRAAERIQLLQITAQQCHDLADMDFTFLYDASRDLFSVGYNVADRRLDSSFYDLLASEARLGSFVAIAQGQIPQDHWFALGRLLTATGTAPALLSWSGSMFEFLMPLLVMPTYENTLLDQTYRAIVRRQITYGKQRGVPWGISESGYNTTDQHLNYQYRAFGVPGLGLKRGLGDDLVIAPYATALALMVAPEAACRNLQQLASDGEQGDCGFFEAIDYSPSRLLPGTTSVTIRQFMAHHEGMTLLSLAYVLLDKPMQRRFDADPMLRATDLLLQERVPKASTPVFPHAAEAGARRTLAPEEHGTMRVFTDPGGAVPEVHLLSNGRYHVVVTSAGGGYSRWRDTAITRWREDATRDCWGSFCYLRDAATGAL